MAQVQAYWGEDERNVAEAAGDDRLIVQFYMEAVQNTEKSEAAGRPIFEDQEFIRIMVPGDSLEMRARPVRPSDKQRFPKQWAAFQAKAEQKVEGTPLSSLPFLTKAQVAEFAARGMTTAEQVRDMSDQLAQQFMGMHKIRRQITHFINAAEQAAPSLKVAAELEKRDNEISSLKKALEDQGKKIQELQPKKG